MFSIDFTFLWTLVNLLILFLFLKKFLFGRVNAFLDKRAAGITDEREHAEKDRAEARVLRESYAKKLHAASAEGDAILKQARAAADAEAGRITGAAREEAARIVKEAE